MLHHPNRYKAMMEEAKKPKPSVVPTTADRLAALTDEQLMAEFDRLLAAIDRREAEIAALQKEREGLKDPPPLPEDQRGYRSPAFQLYQTRKALGYVQAEMEFRRDNPSS